MFLDFPPPYTREMGTTCPFGVFFPLFYSIFTSKLDIVPFKRSVLGALKGHFRTRKGRMVDLGFQDPKPPEMPKNKGKRHNTAIGLATWEKTPKGQVVPISHAHPPLSLLFCACNLRNLQFMLVLEGILGGSIKSPCKV